MQIRIEKQLWVSLLSNCQNTEKLSVNFNVNKVVASSEHESSRKPGSGVYILAEVKYSSRNQALLKTKQKHPEIFCLSSRRWHLITESNRLGQIYSETAIVAYRKDKSLKDLLVRAKIPSHI